MERVVKKDLLLLCGLFVLCALDAEAGDTWKEQIAKPLCDSEPGLIELYRKILYSNGHILWK